MRTIVELCIRCIHLIAAIVWFGGVVFSTFIAMPIVRRHLPNNALLAIHNRLRRWMRLMIHVLLTTGAMVFFIVAWNNDMAFKVDYMLNFVVKLAAFGGMALFWGLHSALYQRHLEEENGQRDPSATVNLFGGLTLIAGLVVFGIALRFKG